MSNIERVLIALADAPAPEVAWNAAEREYELEWWVKDRSPERSFSLRVPAEDRCYYAWVIGPPRPRTVSGHGAGVGYSDEELGHLCAIVVGVMERGERPEVPVA